MKEFNKIEQNLYVSIEDVERMKNGESGVGYIEAPKSEGYELIDKRAFLPVSDEHILNENSYSVVFISE